MPLDRSTEKERIAEADLLIGDAERAVAHQMTEIERLRVEGHDTTKAEELVRAFRRTLETLQEDRQRILNCVRLILPSFIGASLRPGSGTTALGRSRTKALRARSLKPNNSVLGEAGC